MALRTHGFYSSYEEFLEARKSFVGGSDIPSVKNIGRYACSRKLGYDKLGHHKDFDDSGRMEFRRGRRLEGIAANYYAEVTGRETWVTDTFRVPGKPHLAANLDRLIAKQGTKPGENDGYLEIKVMGRFAFIKAKKEGLIDDYILQIQYGMAVADCSWGAFAIYCPDTDELLHWDVEADRALGEHLLEAADDWWQFHKECNVLPEPLPEGSAPCDGCPWALTCRGSIPEVAPDAGIVLRPDLEGLAAKLAEVKGMSSECGDAEDALKAEFLEAIKEKPGIYHCGKWEIPFTITTGKRFNGEMMKKAHPELYEKFRIESTTKTVRKPKEL